MSCNENRETIGDYVDGTLEPSNAVTFEAHLENCARCQAVVADLRTLRAATLTLEPQSPPAHVWASLARAIEAEPRPIAWRTWLRGGGFSRWQPLASAAMLVLLVSALTLVGGQLMSPAVPTTNAARVTTAAVALDGSIDAEMRLAEEQYASAIASLEAITRTDASGLDAHTVDVLRGSVEAIDEAIGESRAALESEPANQLAQDSLFDALRSKVALLQDTVALINEVQQDDPQGATGSSPGINQ